VPLKNLPANSSIYFYSIGGRNMSAHDSEHAHHEPEDESIGVKVGIFFILVLVALYFISL
jgi:hypothetical protein